MPEHPPHPVCSQCNYDLFGITPEENGHITCPECGVSLRPLPSDALFRFADLHRTMFIGYLMPILVSCAVLLASTLLPYEKSMFVFMIYLFAIPTIAFVLFLTVLSIALHRSRPYPRFFSRWYVIPWAILYTIPAVAAYIGAVYAYTKIV